MKALLVSCLIVAAIGAVPARAAAQDRSDAYNAATCIGYPPYDTTGAVPYKHMLYGFKNMAYCHIPMLNNYAPRDLAYVLLAGHAPSGTEAVRFSLCVYVILGDSTCGPERTLTPSMKVNWVAPPAIPELASGAYLQVRFPAGGATYLEQFTVVWTK